MFAAVATLFFNNGKVLLGRRFQGGQFEAWQCPGGFVLQGESIESAAQRHCLNKSGLEMALFQYGPYTHNCFEDKKQTITLYLLCDDYRVLNKLQYENQQDQWSWFDLERLPSPLFLPLINLQNQGRIKTLISSNRARFKL